MPDAKIFLSDHFESKLYSFICNQLTTSLLPICFPSSLILGWEVRMEDLASSPHPVLWFPSRLATSWTAYCLSHIAPHPFQPHTLTWPQYCQTFNWNSTVVGDLSTKSGRKDISGDLETQGRTFFVLCPFYSVMDWIIVMFCAPGRWEQIVLFFSWAHCSYFLSWSLYLTTFQA